jgi:RND family efflux transporter MFP subunit
MLGGAPSMFSMFSDPFRSLSGEGDPAYERYSNVYGQSVLMQTARDQIEMALAGIYELDESIKNLSSVAPFQGVIVKKMVEVGDVVQPGMPIVVFADTSRMYIQVEVPARLVSNLSVDAEVSARLDQGAQPVPVKVDRIFPMANQGGHTTTVKFELPAGSDARAGMYAEVAIPASLDKTKPLAVIPNSAISWRGSLPAVFAISDDNTSLKMRTLRLGKPSGKDMVSVITGISIGDRILKEPLASTRSGPYTAPAL